MCCAWHNIMFAYKFYNTTASNTSKVICRNIADTNAT